VKGWSILQPTFSQNTPISQQSFCFEKKKKREKETKRQKQKKHGTNIQFSIICET